MEAESTKQEPKTVKLSTHVEYQSGRFLDTGSIPVASTNSHKRGIKMLNTVEIRLATIEDKEKLVNLRIDQQKADWGAEYEDVDNSFYTRTSDALDEFLVEKGKVGKKGIIYVAVVNNCIVATCGLQRIMLLPQCNDRGRYGYIFNVYTIPVYRHKGLQNLLFKEVLAYAKRENISEISLETDNEIAIKLYKKFGFKFNSLFMTQSV